jgi:hypothetical protein
MFITRVRVFPGSSSTAFVDVFCRRVCTVCAEAPTDWIATSQAPRDDALLVIASEARQSMTA